MIKLILKTTIFYFVAIFVWSFFHKALAYCPQDEPILCQILKNKPRMDYFKALELTGIVERASDKFKVPAPLLTAIAFQESSFKMGIKAGSDYGLTQINILNIKYYSMDKNRLLTDMEYSVNMGAFILSEFKRRYGKREENYWSRYNTSKQPYRSEYEAKVRRWL